MSFINRISAPFAIDLRTLAVFRVCFSLVVIADICIRTTSLKAHYTDHGIWTRSDAIAAMSDFGFSIHLLSGSAAFQLAVFVSITLLAVFLMIGYRTRLVSILLWLLLVSVNHRNYLILQTSDTLMLGLLFWSIFLPLGARYSIDAALNNREPETKEIRSLPSAAIIFQVLAVYFFGALLKTGDAWQVTGDAVFYALHFGHYTSSIGAWVGEFLPIAMQRYLTWFVYYIELIGPVLILSPILMLGIRYTVVPLLVIMHVGFAVLLTVGIYPYLSITSLLLLIPTDFWDRIENKISNSKRSGLKIYYDTPCVFCRKVCLLLRTFLLLGSTPIAPASSRADIQKILTDNNSWVVEDHAGKKHVRWDAMIVVLERSPIVAPWVSILRGRRMRMLGELFYRWVARNREKLAFLTAFLMPYRSIRLRLPLVIELSVGALMSAVLFSNAVTSNMTNVNNPWYLQRALAALMLNQHWTMFAPEPGRVTIWPFIAGVRTNGDRVDAYLSREETPSLNRPPSSNQYFRNYRWRKYFNTINPQAHWPAIARYSCKNWKENHPDVPITHVVGYVLEENTRVGHFVGNDQWQQELRILGRYACQKAG